MYKLDLSAEFDGEVFSGRVEEQNGGIKSEAEDWEPISRGDVQEQLQIQNT